jgi:hypothetical protein
MNKFSLALTKFYLDTINAEFLGVFKVPVTDKLEVEAIKFTSRYTAKLGQTSLFKAIIIHEKSFENPDMLRYVAAHEYGHYKSLLSLVFTWLILLAWVSGVIMFFYGIFTGWLALWAGGLAALFFGCAMSWVIEYRADSTALDLLGEVKVRQAYTLTGYVPKPPLTWKILSQLTHPSLEMTLAIKKRLDR